MKNSFILLILLFTFLFFTCKKKVEPTPEINVKSLILGKWKLVQYKQDNQSWRDSIGTFYNFINDTLVNTKIFTFACDRKYVLGNSAEGEGIKGINFFPNLSCSLQDWYNFNVTNINNTVLEINYPDYVGGGPLVRKHERYIKE